MKNKSDKLKSGRPQLYNVPTVRYRVTIRKDKEKEMKADIKAIQEKYKTI